jgi:hypothetical protein
MASDVGTTAGLHGRDLFRQGFTNGMHRFVRGGLHGWPSMRLADREATGRTLS